MAGFKTGYKKEQVSRKKKAGQFQLMKSGFLII